MQQELNTDPSAASQQAAASRPDADRRGTSRLRTVYRVARILRRGRYSLARVLNLSDDGMMLSSQLNLMLGDELAVDLSETCSVTGRVVWHDGGRCGLKLTVPTNSAVLLKRLYDEQQGRHARQLRLPLDKAVVVSSELGLQIARVRDISQRGIKLAHDGRFVPGLPVKIQIDPGVERRGIVRWSRDGMAGCILIELLSVEDLASIGSDQRA